MSAKFKHAYDNFTSQPKYGHMTSSETAFNKETVSITYSVYKYSQPEFWAITLMVRGQKIAKKSTFLHLPVGGHTTAGVLIRCGLKTHHTLCAYQDSAKSETGVHFSR